MNRAIAWVGQDLLCDPCVLQVVPPKDCSVCVVVGGSSRPSHLPKQVPAVREEWLLVAAERFEVPNMSKKEFALR